MRRRLALLALAAAGLAALVVPALAAAHPLGNFTVNRYSRVEPAGNRVYVLYVLDLAEIPTFQARERAEADPAAYGAGLVDAVVQGLDLRVDGGRRPLEEIDRSLTFPEGQGGLRTTRLEAVLDAAA